VGRTARIVIMIASLVGIAVCVVLLLNFTADNPTGRRYSSQSPIMVSGADGRQKGADAERVLEKDLDWPRNDNTAQTRCLCRTPIQVRDSRCNTCIVVNNGFGGPYRVPDFVNPKKFIAEAKNAATLSSDDFLQLVDYAIAAKELDIPLWFYVRVDTKVSQKYYDLVEPTGGGIVFYFTTPGYQDPTSRDARTGLVVFAIIFGGAGLGEILSRRQPDEPTKVASRPRPAPANPLKDANDLLHTAKKKAQRLQDEDDSRREM